MTAMTSAITMEDQMPFTFQKRGRIRTAAIWNTSVLKKDIDAEISPSFNAVKKDELKMANPEKRNEKEKMEKACRVKSNSSLS